MNAAVEIISSRITGKVEDRDLERLRYVRCIKASKRVRWDIEADVFRGRSFDFSRKFLPDGLTKVHELDFLDPDDERVMSHVQGRTYACLFGLMERYIGAKILQLASANGLGDPLVVEGLVRFSDEELKHQEMFRRIETAIGAKMPGGYVQVADATEVARMVLGKSTWAVLALTCHIELFTQVHYRESIECDAALSDLYRDVFRYHWLEECQHAVMDEIEWAREDGKLTAVEREKGVEDLIALIRALDGIIKAQAAADAGYFMRLCDRAFAVDQQQEIRDSLLRAYRWQYITSGMQHPHFEKLLSGMISDAQMRRVRGALGPVASG